MIDVGGGDPVTAENGDSSAGTGNKGKGKGKGKKAKQSDTGTAGSAAVNPKVHEPDRAQVCISRVLQVEIGVGVH